MTKPSRMDPPPWVPTIPEITHDPVTFVLKFCAIATLPFVNNIYCIFFALKLFHLHIFFISVVGMKKAFCP